MCMCICMCMCMCICMCMCTCMCTCACVCVCMLCVCVRVRVVPSLFLTFSNHITSLRGRRTMGCCMVCDVRIDVDCLFYSCCSRPWRGVLSCAALLALAASRHVCACVCVCVCKRVCTHISIHIYGDVHMKKSPKKKFLCTKT